MEKGLYYGPFLLATSPVELLMKRSNCVAAHMVLFGQNNQMPET